MQNQLMAGVRQRAGGAQQIPLSFEPELLYQPDSLLRRGGKFALCSKTQGAKRLTQELYDVSNIDLVVRQIEKMPERDRKHFWISQATLAPWARNRRISSIMQFNAIWVDIDIAHPPANFDESTIPQGTPDKVELEAGWFEGMKDILDSFRKSIPWGKPNSLSPFEMAMQGLAQRYAEGSKAVTDKLIAINRLDGEAAAEIMKIAYTKLVTDKPVDGGTTTVLVGVMSGILTGLGADLLAGGLTLGSGALVGGVLGLTGGAALAKGFCVQNLGS